MGQSAAAGEPAQVPSTTISDLGGAPRLLVLTPDFPPARGGIQALMHGLLEELAGFKVRVLAADSPGARAFDAGSALSVARVPAPARAGPARNVPLNLAALREAARWRPAAVLSAHIVTSPATAAIARIWGARIVQYFHANEIGHRPRLSAFAARHADASIAVSSYTAGLLAATGAPMEAVHLIPPGVTVPTDAARLASERPTVLTVSRLSERYKGHDVLLDALALVQERVADVEWVVIGEGPLRAELAQLAHERGLDRHCRFLGSVTDAERDEWLRRADVFAMPSRLPGGELAGEGFGIAFLEASAYGTPVVAGNVGGALDAVRDGESGLLVDPNDARAVAAAISSVLLDPGLAARLGDGGRAWAGELSWPRIARRVQELLVELLDGEIAPPAGGPGRAP